MKEELRVWKRNSNKKWRRERYIVKERTSATDHEKKELKKITQIEVEREREIRERDRAEKRKN